MKNKNSKGEDQKIMQFYLYIWRKYLFYSVAFKEHVLMLT